MTYDHRQPGPGMTAGKMRANGVRSLVVSCGDCHHEALLNADSMAENVEFTVLMASSNLRAAVRSNAACCRIGGSVHRGDH
jgi:hypothetical protein